MNDWLFTTKSRYLSVCLGLNDITNGIFSHFGFFVVTGANATAFSQFNSYSVTVRTELVEVCRSCFDKLSTNGGCNCPKLKTR
ncbi:hypothetical protein CRENPOLYSF1_670052 [Crenothrix polyspora]|uniref:Uncharacterized protein n=1 Tax=Crenothrix polyspora TaxID=360316 RepID=A0A1R4HHI4_9GAMM|nr:hypothetical protein CRENPOLYSF1_670052 [Crenothrix polyspora]